MATQENTKVTQRYGTGVALTLRCSCGSIQLSVNATPVTHWPKATTAGVDLVQSIQLSAKFGELFGIGQIWRAMGQPKKIQKPHSVTAQVLH